MPAHREEFGPSVHATRCRAAWILAAVLVPAVFAGRSLAQETRRAASTAGKAEPSPADSVSYRVGGQPSGSPANTTPRTVGAEQGARAMGDVDQAVVQGNSRFALDLYAKLRDQDPGNLFYSPASLSIALAMAYAGARGETAAEMADVLHFPAAPEAATLHDAFARLRENWTAAPEIDGYRLRVANRLWGQRDFNFLAPFLAITRETYGAELAEVDFRQAADAVAERINAWVEEQTAGKITNLIPPGSLDASTRLVLTNAVYFKGDWAEPFRKEATRDEPFHIRAGEDVRVPMMHHSGRYRAWAGDGLKVLEMPYGKANAMSMLVLLPDAIDGLPALEKRLTAEALDGWIGGLRSQQVNISLPRFTMTTRFSLGETLAAMGMARAFTAGGADFTGMSTEEELCISEVIHKAFVDVNEEGTEAAAATAIGVRATSAIIPTKPMEFRADHPFVFLIRENRTGSLLFLGRLVEPEPAR